MPVFWPWPGGQPTIVHKIDLTDGVFYLIAEPSGQLRVILAETIDGVEHAISDTWSSHLDMPERIPLILGITWGEGEVHAALNGDAIMSSCADGYVPLRVGVRELPDEDRRDFAPDNAAASAKRIAAVKNHPIYSGKVRGDREYAEAELKWSTAALKDFIDHIKRGDHHHINSLAALLRKMVATGKPVPQLQLVAALSEKSLIVYSERRPASGPPPESAVSASFGPWTSPVTASDNPIDLDVWLDLHWGNVGAKNFSHRQAVKYIGDTVGAHFDWDQHPVLATMKANASGLGGEQQDFLLRYLLQLAETVLALAESVLFGSK